MYQIQTLNKISPIGLAQLGDQYQVADTCENPDAILVRSAVMHEMEFGSNLLAIARAGAGVNNIPLDRCAEEGIVVFNTPGANANGVKELVFAGMLLASRDIVGGIEWVQSIKGEETISKMVEKGKSKFAGTEIKGAGDNGLGELGGVAELAAGIDLKGDGAAALLIEELGETLHHLVVGGRIRDRHGGGPVISAVFALGLGGCTLLR